MEDLDESVFTRQSKLFKDKRVEAVLTEIRIGEDLNEEQCVSVVNVLCEIADCFALSLSEVTIIKGAVHKLNIPEGTKFKTRVNQLSGRFAKILQTEPCYKVPPMLQGVGMIRGNPGVKNLNPYPTPQKPIPSIKGLPMGFSKPMGLSNYQGYLSNNI